MLNPSFEDTLLVENLSHLYLCSDWILPTAVSSDWFSTDPNAHCYFCCCSTQSVTEIFGYETPVSGEATTGIILYTDSSKPGEYSQYKEYLEGELSQELTAGATYRVQLNLSLADSSKFAIKKFGVYFSDVVIDYWSLGNSSFSELPFTPQVVFIQDNYYADTSGWTNVNSSFTANGGEKYFIIGSFEPNSDMMSEIVNPNSQSLQFYADYFFDEIVIFHDTSNSILNQELWPKIEFMNGCIYADLSLSGDIEVYNSSGMLAIAGNLRNQPICIESLAKGYYLIVYRNNTGSIFRKGFVQID